MAGEGSVYRQKADGRWVAALSIGPRGSRKLIRRYAPKGDNTKTAAKRRLVKLLAEHQRHDSETTLGVFLSQWIDDYCERDTTGPRQAANARGIIRNHTEAVSHLSLADLRASDVERLLAAAPTGQRRHVYNVLAVALDSAERDGLIERNPVRRVPRPGGRYAEKRPWSMDQARRFLDAVRDDWDGPLHVIAAATGLRQGELLGLRWEDIDLDEATATIGRQLARRDGKYKRVPLKGRARERTEDLPAIAVDALRVQRSRQPVTPIDGGLVFTTEKGRPVNGSTVYHRMQRKAAELGLPPMDFHGWRRFRASLGPKLNIDPKVTQRQLGHSNIATTLGVYTYVDREQAKAAAALVDRALRGA